VVVDEGAQQVHVSKLTLVAEERTLSHTPHTPHIPHTHAHTHIRMCQVRNRCGTQSERETDLELVHGLFLLEDGAKGPEERVREHPRQGLLLVGRATAQVREHLTHLQAPPRTAHTAHAHAHTAHALINERGI
jgi:hypothetical protein